MSDDLLRRALNGESPFEFKTPDEQFPAVSVPWHQQTLVTSKIYDCRRCNFAREAYRAIGNVPEYGHLCRLCWNELPLDIQKHYMGVMKS